LCHVYFKLFNKIVEEIMTEQYELRLNSPDITWVWVCLFIIALGLCIALWFFKINIETERMTQVNQIEYTNLGNELSNASDFLTNNVRAFVMTGNSKHLQNYWLEINKIRTREKVLNRLKVLGSPANELALLEKAKRNSDHLVTTEIRAMKLILLVSGVKEEVMPDAIREFRLTVDDLILSDGHKVKKAREIMFDEKYSQAKNRILAPTLEFIVIMQNRVDIETELVRTRTNITNNIINTLSGLIFAFLILVIWLQLFREPKKSIKVT
jgi:hypothetical protein